jgi:hypothetical protein
MCIWNLIRPQLKECNNLIPFTSHHTYLHTHVHMHMDTSPPHTHKHVSQSRLLGHQNKYFKGMILLSFKKKVQQSQQAKNIHLYFLKSLLSEWLRNLVGSKDMFRAEAQRSSNKIIRPFHKSCVLSIHEFHPISRKRLTMYGTSAFL